MISDIRLIGKGWWLAVPTRRIFELTLITIVLWDLGKGTVRLWTRKTWSSTQPGSPTHSAAELVSIFV